jgi:hypothetical protein
MLIFSGNMRSHDDNTTEWNMKAMSKQGIYAFIKDMDNLLQLVDMQHYIILQP